MQKINSEIFITSRIRLARNLIEEKFPISLDAETSKEVCEKCIGSITKLGKFKKSKVHKIWQINEIQKKLLLEKNFASKDLLESKLSSALIVSEDEKFSVMLNEEDHLRIQCIDKGLKLNTLWRSINAVDNALDKEFDFAYHKDYGYLTSCPTNVGTGMRASVMLHMPALLIDNLMEKVVRGVNQLGMVVRGSNGEGSESIGAFFQLSNQATLGISETDIINRIQEYAKKFAEFETQARLKLLETKPIVLADRFARAIAILKNAKLISSDEAIINLSNLRLASDMGFSKNPEKDLLDIDYLIKEVQTAHLSLIINKENITTLQRDAFRAKLIQKTLNRYSLVKIL